MTPNALLTVDNHGTTFKIQTAHVKFSPYRCFRFGDEAFKSKAFEAIGKRLLALDRIALAGDSDFARRLLQAVPGLEAKVGAFITKGKSSSPAGSIPVVSAENLPEGIKTVFLCETRTFEREKLAESMPAGVEVLDAWMLPDLMAYQEIPHHCWVYLPKSIYPLQVPPIEFRPNLDMLLIDCPARNLALMPNGLGYVHNTLKKTGLDFQTFDVDITIYHRFHIHRIFDWGGRVILDNGRELPIDPWQAEHYDVWTDPAVIDYFKVHILDLVAAITNCKPKILGMSVHGCNIEFSREVMKQVKAALPETQILVGGFSCYNADIGRRDLPECDYMCIAESDLTVGPLVERLAMGERPFNQAGVLSRYDTPDYKYLPAPLPHNLDFIEFPKYEWFDLSLYRNYNGYQLTPIIASRGCRWSRCTFCAERFYWRIRSTEDFMKELRWLVSRGCDLFMFNESDLNGMPDKVLEICDAIIASGLKVKLTGQLRINKDSDLAFFSKLRRAGFVALRFGVDAFSENTLRLQKKGYRKETATQNLRDCKRAGIYTEINWVIGVPGETEEDVDEGIAFCIANMPYIGRIANINPLMVVQGSVYWIEPDAHNIKFRGDREELFRMHPRAMPAQLWYSTDPYIDADVRTRWFNKIVRSLHEAGFDMGSWAKRVVDDVESGRDANRTSGTKTVEAQAEPAAVRNAAKQEAPPPQVPDQATESPKAKPAQKGMEFIYRVDSAGQAEPEPEKPEERMRVLKHRDRYFMVDPEQVQAERIKQPFLLSFFKSKHSPILAVLKSKDLKVLNARLTEVEPRILQALGSSKILELDGQYFSLPQSTRLRDVRWADQDLEQTPGLLCAGSLREIIDLTRSHLQARGETVDATSIDSADARVDMSALLSTGLAAATLKDPEPPQLVDNVRNYNIVFHRGSYIGIPRELGAMDLEKQDPRGKPGVLVDECLANLERRILDPSGVSMPELRISLDVPAEGKDGGSGNGHHHEHEHEHKHDQAHDHAHAAEVEEPPADPLGPPILLRQIRQFNIVRYKGVYYGMPQSAGPVDLTVQDVKLMPGVVHSDSLAGAEAEIRKVIEAERSGTGHAPKHGSPPQLIEVIKDYNVVYYAGTYYALHQRLGSIDLQKQDVKGIAGVVHDASHPGLLVKLEELIGPLQTATPKNPNRPEARATKPATPTESQGKSNSTPLPASNRSSGAAQMSGSKHPVFIKTLEHYNILQYAGYYYALPQQMGEVDLEVIDAMTLPGMIYDVSLAALENEVNDACAKERAKMP